MIFISFFWALCPARAAQRSADVNPALLLRMRSKATYIYVIGNLRRGASFVLGRPVRILPHCRFERWTFIIACALALPRTNVPPQVSLLNASIGAKRLRNAALARYARASAGS